MHSGWWSQFTRFEWYYLILFLFVLSPPGGFLETWSHGGLDLTTVLEDVSDNVQLGLPSKSGSVQHRTEPLPSPLSPVHLHHLPAPTGKSIPNISIAGGGSKNLDYCHWVTNCTILNILISQWDLEMKSEFLKINTSILLWCCSFLRSLDAVQLLSVCRL